MKWRRMVFALYIDLINGTNKHHVVINFDLSKSTIQLIISLSSQIPKESKLKCKGIFSKLKILLIVGHSIHIPRFSDLYVVYGLNLSITDAFPIACKYPFDSISPKRMRGSYNSTGLVSKNPVLEPPAM